MIAMSLLSFIQQYFCINLLMKTSILIVLALHLLMLLGNTTGCNNYDPLCSGGLCVAYSTFNSTTVSCVCNKGFSSIQSGTGSYCVKCDTSCLTCYGPNDNNCVTCSSGFKLDSSSNTCQVPNNATVITVQSSYKFLGFSPLISWSSTGTPLVSNVCNVYSLLGGSNTFTNTVKISTNYLQLLPHYQVRLKVALFWIGTNDFNFKIILSDTTGPLGNYLFADIPPPTASNAFCSDTTSYWANNIDQTVPFTASNMNVTFQTNGGSGLGYWGIREYILILNLCNIKVCSSCNGPAATNCLTCTDPYKSANIVGSLGTCICYGTNDSPTYFLHPELQICVSPCPMTSSVTYYGDPISRTCVANCSSIAPKVNPGRFNTDYVNLNISTVTWNLYMADDNTNMCVYTCPQTSTISILMSNSAVTINMPVYYDLVNRKCVANCPSTQPYHWSVNSTCYSICPNKTNSGILVDYFIDYATNSCVTDCPTNPNVLYKYNGKCLANCPYPLYADPVSGSCVASCVWSQPFYFKDNSTGFARCIQTCPAPNYFGDINLKSCIQVCNSTSFGDTDISGKRRCVAICSGSYFGITTGSRLCVQNCPAGTWGLVQDPLLSLPSICVTYPTQCLSQYADNYTNKCVDLGKCSLKLFSLNSTKTCVLYCPNNTYASNQTFVCQSNCNTPYFADNSLNYCVLYCFQNNTYADKGSGNVCVSKCNYYDNYPFAEEQSKSCVNKCSVGYFADSLAHKCVVNCTTGSYAYLDPLGNNTCLAVCPNNYYADNSTGTGLCVQSCPSLPPTFGDALAGNICNAVCTFPNFGPTDLSRVCTKPCSANFFAQSDSLRRCVSRCGTNTYGLDRVCHTAIKCPTGFGDDSTNMCVSNCPANPPTFADITTNKCVTSCPLFTVPKLLYYYANTNTRTCQQVCGPNQNGIDQFGNNSTQTCVTKCLDLNSFADTNSYYRYCIANCTLVYSGNPPVITYYYRDNATKTCVLSTGCSSNLYGDNNTLNCESSCSKINGVQTWAYNFTWTCVAQCYNNTWSDFSSGRGICVKLCPVIPPSWSYDGNMSCMTTCPQHPAMYGEDFTRTCVSLCPDTTLSYDGNRTCVSICPPSYFGDDTSTVRACWSTPSSCSSYGGLIPSWADNYTHKCTILCTSDPIDTYGDNLTSLCTQKCSNGTYADTSTRICVAVCPLNTFGDPLTWRCVTQCLITPNTWADSATITCTYQCSNITYSQNISQTCVIALACPTTPDILFGSNKTWACVIQCFMNSTVKEYADRISRTCVSVCPNITTVDYFTIFYGDISTGAPLCVHICPVKPVMFGLNSTQLCVSQCPIGTYGDQTGNRTCIAVCPIDSDLNQWYGQSGSQLCVLLCSNGTYGNNISSTCVTPTNCPPATFADPSINMCVDKCPLAGWNYFGDPSTQTCVPICPNISKVIVLSPTVNISVGISYSEPINRLCVRKCPLDLQSGVNTFGDNSTNNCVNLCPIGTYADPQTENRVCVLLCAQPAAPSTAYFYADPSTRSCVSICPSNPPYFGQTIGFTCVSSCTGVTFADYNDRVCTATCPNNYFRSTYLKNQCVLICSSVANTFGDTTTKNCVATCPSGSFANTISRLCVTDCSLSSTVAYNGTCVRICPTGYYANSNMCVTPANCGANKYGQNSTSTCQSLCLTGNADPNSFYCIAVCPVSWYASGGICVSSCPSGYASSANNSCVANCPQNTFSNGTTCVQICLNGFADNSTQECTSICQPINSIPTYGDPTTKTCVFSCPANYYINSGQCTNFCGNKYADFISNQCTNICTPPTWGYAGNSSCVNTCPTNYYASIPSRVCQSISQFLAANLAFSTVFADIVGIQWGTCPYGYYGDLTTGICGTSCASHNSVNYYADPTTNICVPSCPKPYSSDSTINKCVIDCSVGLFSQQGTTSNICVKVCSSITFADFTTRQCVEICPTGYFGFYNSSNFTGTCLTKCPANYAGDSNQNYQCSINCMGGTFFDNVTNLCVTSCNQTFADNVLFRCVKTCVSIGIALADNSTNTCVNICPSIPDYYGSNNVCVAKCPNNTFAQTIGRICVKRCQNDTSDVYYGDPTTGKCSLTCGVNYWGDNFTNTCNTSCSSNSYADNFTGKCVAKCPASQSTFADSKTNICALVCSGYQFANIDDQTCVEKCTGSFYSDPLSRTCVTDCPIFGYSFKYQDSNGNNSCLTTCLNKTYADNHTRTCQTLTSTTPGPTSGCTSGTYADNSTWACVARCPIGTFAQNSTNTCVITCLVGFSDYNSGYCVAVCPSNPLMYGSAATCNFICPTNTFGDNVTNLCVKYDQCSADYFSDTVTGLCVLFCSDGYFAENITKSCKATCPDSSFADNLTKKCVSICPTATQGTYGDVVSNICVRVCPPTYYAGNISQLCLTSCASQSSEIQKAYADDLSKFCVATCPAYPLTFGYNLTNTCVAKCPIGFGDWNSRTCVSACVKVGQVNYFADITTSLCVQVCPDNYYGDTNSMSCVLTCTDSSWFRDDSTKLCVSSCPSVNPITYGDPLIHRCVINCSKDSYANGNLCDQICPVGFYRDNSTYSCVSKCPTKPFYYSDGHTGYCVSQCSPGYFADPVSQTCVNDCPSDSGIGYIYFKDLSTNICVLVCPLGTYAVNATQTCTSSCPSLTFADNTTRICLSECTIKPYYFADGNLKICSSTCSNPYFAHIPDQTCKPSCPSSYFGDLILFICVTNCSDGYYADSNTKTCNTVCSSSIDYADPVTRTCTSTCSTGYYKASNPDPVCLQFCPSGFAQDGVCGPSCKTGTYANQLTNTCEPNCTYPYFADVNVKACVTSCTNNYFASSKDQTCVLTCPNLPVFTYGDPTTKKCVVVCPTGSYGENSTSTCVKTCPSGQFADGSTQLCVPQCPALPSLWGYIDSNGNGYCVIQCTGNVYADNTTRKCQSSCPNKTIGSIIEIYFAFADSKANICVLYCPDGYFANSNNNKCEAQCTNGFGSTLTNECVTKCPNTPISYFANNFTRICTSQCPQFSFGDISSATCLEICPSDYWGDPKTNLCVKICPSGYYAYNITSKCVPLLCPSISPSQFTLFSDPTNRQCATSCTKPSLFADPTSGSCVYKCPAGYYASVVGQICILICNLTNTQIKQFAYSGNNTCLEQCPFPYLGDQTTWTCVINCPSGSYADLSSSGCAYCPSSCVTCISLTQCNSCVINYVLNNGVCGKTCNSSNGVQLYSNGTMCVAAVLCPTKTFGDNSTTLCAENCSIGTYGDNTSKICLLCPINCTSCTSPSSCQSCKTNNVLASGGCYPYCSLTAIYTYNGACYKQCPDGSYLSFTKVTCQNCDPSCNTCAKVSTFCLSCGSSFLYNNTCIAQCPKNYYGDSKSGNCLLCTNKTIQCIIPLYFNTTVTYSDYKYVVYLTFSGPIVISILEQKIKKSLQINLILNRLLQVGSFVNNGIQYTYEIMSSTIVKVTLKLNTTLVNPKIVVSFTDPTAVIAQDGGSVLQNTKSFLPVQKIDYYPPESGSAAGTNTLSIFMAVLVMILTFLGWLVVPLSILPILHTFQLLYFHLFINFLMPANLYFYLRGFRMATLYFFPNILATGLQPGYFSPKAPQVFKDTNIDFNFSRNAGGIVFILLVYGVIAFIIYSLTRKVTDNKVWKNLFKQMLEERVKYSFIHEILFMFFLNIIFYGFSQLRDPSSPFPFEGFNVFLGIVFAFVFLGAPFYFFYKVIKNRNEPKELQPNFQFLYRYQKNNIKGLIVTPLYYIRGILFVILLLAFFDYPLGQLYSIIIVNALFVTYLIVTHPFKENLNNVMHIGSEFILIFLEAIMLYYNYHLDDSVSVKTTNGLVAIIVVGIATTILVIWGIFRIYMALEAFWDNFRKSDFYHEYINDGYINQVQEELMEIEEVKPSKIELSAIDPNVTVQKVHKELDATGKVRIKVLKKKRKLKVKKSKKKIVVEDDDNKIIQLASDEEPEVLPPKPEEQYVRVNYQNMFDRKLQDQEPIINPIFSDPSVVEEQKVVEHPLSEHPEAPSESEIAEPSENLIVKEQLKPIVLTIQEKNSNKEEVNQQGSELQKINQFQQNLGVRKPRKDRKKIKIEESPHKRFFGSADNGSEEEEHDEEQDIDMHQPDKSVLSEQQARNIKEFEKSKASEKANVLIFEDILDEQRMDLQKGSNSGSGYNSSSNINDSNNNRKGGNKTGSYLGLFNS